MTTPSSGTPLPPSEGSDSVMDIHRPHMAEMNDASMTFDGEPPDEDRDTVQTMLDMLAREHAEPRDGFEPVPFWVACVFGGLLAWGGYYIGTNSADYRADIFDRSDLRLPEGGSGPAIPDPDPQSLDELNKIGQQKYQAICASCHLPTGEGKPGEGIPPLKGSEWVVGEQASAARLSRIVLYGLSGPIPVRGKTYNGVMPNQGNVFKDYEIASVLTYIRNNKDWGHAADKDKPPAVSTAAVKAARAKEGTRKTNGTAPVNAAELQKLTPDYSDTGAPPPAPKKDEKKEKDKE